MKQREERSNVTWKRRRDIPLAILAWTAVVALMLWAAGHIIRSLLLLTLAALFAYALAPAVKLLARFMPRWLAILLVYVLVLSGISALLFLIVNTAIAQVASLSHSIGFLLTPTGTSQLTPLEQTLRSIGIYRQHFEQMPGNQRAQFAQQMPSEYGADPNNPQGMAQGFQRMGQEQPGILSQLFGQGGNWQLCVPGRDILMGTGDVPSARTPMLRLSGAVHAGRWRVP
jgi:predicted PurR-regulated permease PerM